MSRVNVVKSDLPDEREFFSHLKEVFANNILTNNGPKCQELERVLAKFLDAEYLTICSNGTVAIEMAIRAANAAGRPVITTPFTYVATITAPMWVGCEVIFADIDPETLCIDPLSIAERITDQVAAVIPVNIYGHPCDDEGIREAAGGVPIIYDAAQAFGAKLDGRSLFDFGDFATCSLHATKVFHCGEGGFVVAHSAEKRRELCLLRAFGHDNDEYESVGINAKMSELHACVGLSLLKDYYGRLEKRKKIDGLYRALLKRDKLRFPSTPEGFESNYGYFPVILKNENLLSRVVRALNQADIFPRRYFYPALTTLTYTRQSLETCPVAEDIAKRVLCLPLYASLPLVVAEKIVEIVNSIE
ncbi:MAG: DegT/DnrJ/EryC1/StrS family aminotransferase [Desulfovibrio sp.]|nr:DegT/DnrJ/EryC1/StrS family aminotransferase [Desulfovibrio sp.]